MSVPSPAQLDNTMPKSPGTVKKRVPSTPGSAKPVQKKVPKTPEASSANRALSSPTPKTSKSIRNKAPEDLSGQARSEAKVLNDDALDTSNKIVKKKKNPSLIAQPDIPISEDADQLGDTAEKAAKADTSLPAEPDVKKSAKVDNLQNKAKNSEPKATSLATDSSEAPKKTIKKKLPRVSKPELLPEPEVEQNNELEEEYGEKNDAPDEDAENEVDEERSIGSDLKEDNDHEDEHAQVADSIDDQTHEEDDDIFGGPPAAGIIKSRQSASTLNSTPETDGIVDSIAKSGIQTDSNVSESVSGALEGVKREANEPLESVTDTVGNQIGNLKSTAEVITSSTSKFESNRGQEGNDTVNRAGNGADEAFNVLRSATKRRVDVPNKTNNLVGTITEKAQNASSKLNDLTSEAPLGTGINSVKNTAGETTQKGGTVPDREPTSELTNTVEGVENKNLDIQALVNGVKPEARGDRISAAGIEINVQTNSDGMSLTIKIPGSFQQH